jgi:hypothetical protein
MPIGLEEGLTAGPTGTYTAADAISFTAGC